MVALLAEGVDRNIDNLGSIFDSSVSPSSRRAWIEISTIWAVFLTAAVALLAEGVDRNKIGIAIILYEYRRPPRGGRG